MDSEELLDIAAGFDAQLADRLRFILEIDRLKNIVRKNVLADRSRNENSAEHSWHLAMTALVMAPYAKEPIELEKVVKTLLIHDVVEIDAGDVDIFDTDARADNEANEQRAAERIFGLLPEPDGSELRVLWEEFEARSTPEARFAYSCDRLQPFLLNVAGGGETWAERGVTAAQVRKINSTMEMGLNSVWPVANVMLDATVTEGVLKP
jgi:putative hydrolases of HD superfamily